LRKKLSARLTTLLIPRDLATLTVVAITLAR
jgi:hypothetical protein